MRTLDEQLDVATRELHEALNGSSLAPASTVARRHKRRRRSLTALAGVTAVAVVIGLTIVVTRDVDSSEPGSPPDPTANTLLFPAGIADADMGKVYLGPDLSARAKGLVESPGGVVFLLSVGDRNGQPMTPNVARREINGNTFTVEIIEGTELVYVALNDWTRPRCSRRRRSPGSVQRWLFRQGGNRSASVAMFISSNSYSPPEWVLLRTVSC
jgi:hypothetical protein